MDLCCGLCPENLCKESIDNYLSWKSAESIENEDIIGTSNLFFLPEVSLENMDLMEDCHPPDHSTTAQSETVTAENLSSVASGGSSVPTQPSQETQVEIIVGERESMRTDNANTETNPIVTVTGQGCGFTMDSNLVTVHANDSDSPLVTETRNLTSSTNSTQNEADLVAQMASIPEENALSSTRSIHVGTDSGTTGSMILNQNTDRTIPLSSHSTSLIAVLVTRANVVQPSTSTQTSETIQRPDIPQELITPSASSEHSGLHNQQEDEASVRPKPRKPVTGDLYNKKRFINTLFLNSFAKNFNCQIVW